MQKTTYVHLCQRRNIHCTLNLTVARDLSGLFFTRVEGVNRESQVSSRCSTVALQSSRQSSGSDSTYSDPELWSEHHQDSYCTQSKHASSVQ